VDINRATSPRGLDENLRRDVEFLVNQLWTICSFRPLSTDKILIAAPQFIVELPIQSKTYCAGTAVAGAFRIV
jgi:hypothetical protein